MKRSVCHLDAAVVMIGIGVGSVVMASEPPAAGRALDPLADVSVIDEHLWVQAVSRRMQPIFESAQSVAVLDLDDWVVSSALTLPDRLRYEAGIDVYQARHGQYDIGMRGFNGLNTPRTLALLDGRSLAFDHLGAIPWVGAVHLSDIDRIELVKGPASVTYGANAFGGAISFATRRPDDVWRWHAVGSQGTGGLVDVDVTTLGPLGHSGDLAFDLKASVGHSRRDDLPGHRGDQAPDDGHPRTGRSGSDDLIATRSAVTLGMDWGDAWRAEASWRWLDLDAWDMIEDMSTGSNVVAIERHSLGLMLRSSWLEADHEHVFMDTAYSNQIVAYNPLEDYRYVQIGTDESRSTSALRSYLDFGQHHLSLGAEYTRWRSTSNLWSADGEYADRDSWATVTANNIAAYAEHQWTPAGPWSATAGLRLDRHSDFGTNFSPRLAISRRLEDDSFVRASFLSGYRLPIPLETYTKEYFFTSDPDIEAETIRSVDVEWRGRYETFDLGITGFFNRVNRTPFYMPLPEGDLEAAWLAFLARMGGGDFSTQPGPFLELRNLDNPIHVWGVEVDGAWRPDERWRLWAAATWQSYRHRRRIDFSSDGFDDPFGVERFRFDEQLPRDLNGPPPWKLSTGVSWHEGPVFAAVTMRLVDERLALSIPHSKMIDPAAALSEDDVIAVRRIPSYAAVDLAIGYHMDHGHQRETFLRLAISNLFNSRHHEAFPASSRDLSDADEDQYAATIGRAINLSVGMRF